MLKFMVSKSPFKGEDDKYHYVYKTTNNVTGHIYIGCRIFKGKSPELDTYLGCGVCVKEGSPEFIFGTKHTPFLDAIREFGVSNFSKEILLYCGSNKMALFIEKSIVDEEFIEREDTYNKVIGGGNPPVGRGIKNNNAGNLWSEEKKKDASEKRKLLQQSVGASNGKAAPCVLYDFLEDKSYNLSYMREAWEVTGEKLDINWVGVMKYRYFLHLPDENPYTKAMSLKKPPTTLAILDCIKRGLTENQARQELKLKNITGAIITRTYKEINK